MAVTVIAVGPCDVGKVSVGPEQCVIKLKVGACKKAEGWRLYGVSKVASPLFQEFVSRESTGTLIATTADVEYLFTSKHVPQSMISFFRLAPRPGKRGKGKAKGKGGKGKEEQKI